MSQVHLWRDVAFHNEWSVLEVPYIALHTVLGMGLPMHQEETIVQCEAILKC